MQRLHIYISDNLQPIQRGEKYDLPLCDLFDEIGGEILGSGSLVRDGEVVECDVGVEVVDAEIALPRIIQILRRANAPQHTRIENDDGEVIFRVT